MKKLNINDFNDLKKFSERNPPYKDGVFTLQLISWNEFHSVVKKFDNNTDYIWRGQKDDKLLQSSFDRHLPKDSNRQTELNKIYKTLEKRLKDLPNACNYEYDEIWAIGQHYGLRTPLLDWTESPYFAAYFASYEKKEKQNNNRVVYALNKSLRLLIREKEKDRFVKFDLPDSNFDDKQNKRLVNQKGKFTKALEGNDIESVVEKFWRRNKKRNKEGDIILAKILIPDEFQNECLANLKAMNITHGVLFPDYAGAVDICKIDLDIDGKNDKK